MKNNTLLFLLLLMSGLIACNNAPKETNITTDNTVAAIPNGGQANVQDDVSAKDIDKVALS